MVDVFIRLSVKEKERNKQELGYDKRNKMKE